MLDGAGLEIPITTAEEWKNNPCLEFTTKVNLRTGVMGCTQTAKYNGLLFIIKTDDGGKAKRAFVRGSLHKYFNKGEHNANDFTFSDLISVIDDLKSRFGIDPETADLRNIEFGVNINTPESVQELLNSFVACGDKMLIPIMNKSKLIGWEVKRQQYRIKVYEKGKPFNIDNIMRVEYAVKKMEYLKKHNIKTLADCIDINKLQPLGGLLVSFWDNLIFCEEKYINWQQMSNKKKAMLNEYRIPIKWQTYTKEERKTKKLQFKNIMQGVSTSTNLQTLKATTESFWALLCNSVDTGLDLNPQNKQPKNTPDLTTCATVKKRVKMQIEDEPIITPNTPDLTIRIKGQTGGKNIYPNSDNSNSVEIDLEEKKKSQIKQKTTPKVCKCCGKDITHKSKIAVYCSKRCNNKVNGQKRTKRQKQQRKAENIALSKAIEHYQSKGIEWLTIETRTPEDIQKAVKLSPSEIRADRATINTIVRVTIILTDKGTKKPLILNAGRCRKLIRIINKSNLANELQETGTITQNQRKAKKQGARNKSPKKTPAKIRTA
ncbi:hypothetical protein D1Z98_01040 [Riemerella anatipestifer]|uniref:hypothetical protein n=1 Tax=Riemerella anatipestifer TaxID=34085 RepID=UPI00129D9EF3|nr:hypothetical protein [Riemerella anatipestifer]MRM93607.1 hypothetical protein [Riemerella anatipestifer]